MIRPGHPIPRAALLSALLLLPAAGSARAAPPAGGGGPPPAAVLVSPVRAEELQDRRRVTGELRAMHRSRVATQEPGLVVEMPVEEGQTVRAGQVIARLDGRRLTIERDRLAARARSLQATISSWQAQAAREQGDVAALTALSARAASNPKELADAKLEAKTASARLEAARGDLEVLEAEAALVATRLEDMTIRAPYGGVVVARSAERGEWVAEGDALVEIVSTGACEAWLHVPQRAAKAVRQTAGPVQVRVDATGEMIAAARSTIVPLVDSRARTFDLYVPVQDPEGILAPGMTVTGWVPTGEKARYLTVPRDAVLHNAAGFYVFLARPAPGGGTRAMAVPLEVLFEAGGRLAVREGRLSEGALVVVEGNERLFPMMPIAPAPMPAPREAEGPDASGDGAGRGGA